MNKHKNQKILSYRMTYLNYPSWHSTVIFRRGINYRTMSNLSPDISLTMFIY